MKAVAVKELKNRLSAYLKEVAHGEIVLVTDRGRVVAELRKARTDVIPTTTEHVLEQLHQRGMLTPGLPQDPDVYRPSRVTSSLSSQALLDSERGGE